MWLVRNKVGFSFSKSGQKKVWKNWKVFKRFHGESHSHYSRLIDYIPIEFTCTCQCRCMATNNDDAVDSLCCVIYSSAYAFSFLTTNENIYIHANIWISTLHVNFILQFPRGELQMGDSHHQFRFFGSKSSSITLG